VSSAPPFLIRIDGFAFAIPKHGYTYYDHDYDHDHNYDYD